MITLTIPSFYIFIGILVVFCLVDIIYVAILKPLFYDNKVKKAIVKECENNNIECKILKNKTDGANFALKIDDKLYLIKVLYVASNCEIQINNIDTFVVYKKATSSAMKAKTLPDMSKFMKSKKANRVIVLANKVKAVKKVINECEMIMVNPLVDIYGVRLLNFNEFTYFSKK